MQHFAKRQSEQQTIVTPWVNFAVMTVAFLSLPERGFLIFLRCSGVVAGPRFLVLAAKLCCAERWIFHHSSLI
jgi:hypothetical protein